MTIRGAYHRAGTTLALGTLLLSLAACGGGDSTVVIRGGLNKPHVIIESHRNNPCEFRFGIGERPSPIVVIPLQMVDEFVGGGRFEQ